MKAKEARMAAVIEDYNEGLTVKEIMDKHDLSYKTVKEYLRLYKMENESDYHRKKTEESEERARVMAGEFANGMTTQEIADRHGVDKTSVMLALRLNRTANADPDALYRRLMCTAKTKRYIREWAKDKAGRILRTPDGELAVMQVHKNGVMLCTDLKQVYRTSFTAGQLFYMNGGR